MNASENKDANEIDTEIDLEIFPTNTNFIVTPQCSRHLKQVCSHTEKFFIFCVDYW